ncbi:hypothetical protein AKG39_02490 [Acetobacterium bakii]|uniref:Type II secretion system protein GspF domain-containing protein n=2 Tax=Acetobacterium bakii TaxID=52689 RepID=A0A0L6U3E5_9FIRM|nr:type II secretion system F family protein [Acetobacterium bakii]KNZ43044.1 hypothetical protein AKG39_02490 [Acetobacterium bakii]
MIKTFAYKAKNAKGENTNGVLQASTQQEAAVVLHNRNLVVLEITEENRVKLFLNKNLNFRLGHVKTKEFSRFCRKFHIILSAGVPIARCLELLKDQTRDTGFARDLSAVCQGIRAGEGLSQAMAAYPKSFPTLFLFMVEAGERSGNLCEILMEMADHYENQEKNHRQMQQVFFYPIILVLVSVLVVVFLLTNVLPTFVGMFKAMDAPLPEPTRILLGMSQTLIADWPMMLLLMVAFLLLLRFVLEIPRVALFKDFLKIKLPGIGGLNKKCCLVILSKTMALLLKSGMDLLSVLDRLDGITENQFIKREVRKLVKKVSSGSSLTQAMEESLVFPIFYSQLVSIGETSGSLPEVLGKIALIYDDEVKNSIKFISTAVEPLILLILGGAVLFILAAIMLPVFDIYTAYSGM